MNTLFSNSILALAATLTLANCSANKALDATASVPGKMDQTNEKMDTMVGEVKKTNAGMETTNKGMAETNTGMATMVTEVQKTNDGMNTMIGEVKKTNAGMDTMVGEVKKTNDGMTTMVGEVQKTNSNMNTMISEVQKTNDGMLKTNLGIHRQTLQIAVADMLREDNSRFLAPPVGMMLGGQIFSLEATPEELIQFVYVSLNFVFNEPQSEQDKTNPDSFNHAKLVRLAAASTIAGLAPQTTIDAIVQSQIIGGGAYQQAAVALLAMRFQFIQSWIVNPKIDGTTFSNDKAVSKLTTPGMIADVAKYAEELSSIAVLPFSSSIGLRLTGLSDDTLNLQNSAIVSPKKDALKIWKVLNIAIAALDPQYTDAKSPFAQQVADLTKQVASHLPAPKPADAAPVVAKPAPPADEPTPDQQPAPKQAAPATDAPATPVTNAPAAPATDATAAPAAPAVKS